VVIVVDPRDGENGGYVLASSTAVLGMLGRLSNSFLLRFGGTIAIHSDYNNDEKFVIKRLRIG
jgi:hypothetical protein